MPVGLRDTFFVVVRLVDLLTKEEKRWMCREDGSKTGRGGSIEGSMILSFGR